MKSNIMVTIASLLISSTIFPIVQVAEQATTYTTSSESVSEAVQVTETSLTESSATSESLITDSTSIVTPPSVGNDNVKKEANSTTKQANSTTKQANSTTKQANSTTKQATTVAKTKTATTKVKVKRLTPHPEVQAMLEALTPEDLAKAVGSDGTGAGAYREEAAIQTPDARSNFTNTTTNINQYIATQNFANPVIERDSRYNNLPQYYYKNARPIGVVVHETANPKSTITGEVDYMYNNYYNAFVHAFVDKSKVVETAPTEYLAWGAGPNANPYYFHIELVRESSLWAFAKSVNNNAYWIASQLYQWGLTPTLADNNSGKGSVISHHAVSNYLGGSNHVDPTGYFASWNYDMNQFFVLIQSKYNAIKASDTRQATIKTTTTFNSEMLVANGNYYLYTNPYNTPGATRLKLLSSESPNGSSVTVKKSLVTSAGTKVYLLSNGLYVDQRALKLKATVVKEEVIDQVMSVKDLNVYLYNLPYNTVGSFKQKKLSEVYQLNQQVKVKKALVTSQNSKVYQLDNGYYVTQKALKPLATITKQTTYDKPKNMRIATLEANFYSHPFDTLDMKTVGTLATKLIVNDNVEVTKYAETSAGVKNYYINGIGWLDTSALAAYHTFTETSNFKAKEMMINSVSYGIYKNPYRTYDSGLLEVLNKRYKKNQKVRVTRYGKTSGGVQTYYINQVGWVDYRALKELPTYKDNAMFKAKNMRIKSTAYNIYSAPYSTRDSRLLQTIKSKYAVNDKVKVTRFGTTSNGTKTYYIDQIGWVDHRALKEMATFKEITTFKAKPLNIKQTKYNIYSAPYLTEKSQLVTKVKSKYKVNDKVKVTRFGTTSTGTKTYYIEHVGWVDYRVFESN